MLPLLFLLALVSFCFGQEPTLSGISSFDGPYGSEQQAYDAVFADLVDGYSLVIQVYGDRVEYSHGSLYTWDDEFGDWYGYGEVYFWIHPVADQEDA